MDMNASRDLAGKQLDRILSFFSRVETKASFIFALDTGLLAALALNLQLSDISKWYISLPFTVAILIIAGSLYFVYRAHFPQLDGGASSLIYFREIARRTEANFIEESLRQKDEQYTRDLLGQIWRNSEILTAKYAAVKVAFILSFLALIPWIVFLSEAAVAHTAGLVLK